MTGKELKMVRLYVMEEQEILREAYKAIFSPGVPVYLVDISNGVESGVLKNVVSETRPDVLLMSARKLDWSIIEELRQVRAEFPQIGIVILLVLYNAESMQLLRSLAVGAEGGMAVFLKQTLDRVDQLFGIIMSVTEGQVILDPALTSLMFAEKHRHPLVRGLTSRETDVLTLMAQGYTNSAIAQTLYIDTRTVQHHINNMYSKFKADVNFNNKHPRVSATRLYLETTGELLCASIPK